MSQLNFMMITASPDIAAFIEQHGVVRIFMDQEVMGKAERQGHLDTHKAAHSVEQVEADSRGNKEVFYGRMPAQPAQQVYSAAIRGVEGRADVWVEAALTTAGSLRIWVTAVHTIHIRSRATCIGDRTAKVWMPA